MNLRDKMFLEMEEGMLFNKAKEYSLNYSKNAFTRNVFPTDEAIENLGIFNEKLPDTIQDPNQLLQQLHKHGSPATVSQIGGRYYGLVNGGIIPASLAVKWLTDTWDQNTPLYVTSPIVSKLEEITETWLKELLGLPEKVVAGFVSGTSMAIFCGLAAARYRIYKNLKWDVNRKGLKNAPEIKIIAGKQAHGTVVKAVALLGFGTDNIQYINTDDQGRILTSSIPELDRNSILLLQAGNVNSGAFDDFAGIIKKARKVNAWVHIDGAFGLWAAATENYSYLTRGINLANSWSVDGHKTLNAPYDNGIILCDDREALVSALQAMGSYIVYSDRRDGMLYTPEMSRRARVVELWATLKYLGKKGINELVEGLCLRAFQFSEELKKNGFNILNDVVFNQVLVACESDYITNKTIQLVQESGECWVGGATWNGQSVIRISVCSWATTKEDVSRSVQAFCIARDKARNHG